MLATDQKIRDGHNILMNVGGAQTGSSALSGIIEITLHFLCPAEFAFYDHFSPLRSTNNFSSAQLVRLLMITQIVLDTS